MRMPFKSGEMGNLSPPLPKQQYSKNKKILEQDQMAFSQENFNIILISFSL
jgi:hypothetical protein